MRTVGPAQDFLEALPPGSVDAIITDPPWLMAEVRNPDSQRDTDNATRGKA